jgi:hypothetical protein
MIKGENFNATRFWLQNNNKRYVPIRTTYVEPRHDHRELKLGERCNFCGKSEPANTSTSGKLGFYEQELADNKKKFEAEARKKRKMTGKEKKELAYKALLRKEGAEFYEGLAKKFPEYEGYAEEVRIGTREPPRPHGMGGKQPKKEENQIDEETVDRY